MAPKQPAAKTPRGGAYVELRGVFVYTITLDAKGLTDQYIAYIQNFK